MIHDPLIYLIVERIKHLSSSGINLEEIDCQLNILDQVLFSTNDTDNDYYRCSKSEYTNYIHRLTNSYLHLDQEDYQSIGIEANIWFFELFYDYIDRRNNLSVNSESIDRLAYLYVILDHPYCRYLVMMICLSLSENQVFSLDDVKNKIWSAYEKQKPNMHYERVGEHIDKVSESLERDILMEEIETILDDIDVERRSEIH